MDGLAAAAAIRQQETEAGQGQRLPIVALTADALVGDAERSRAAGMDDHLTKPLTRERLAAVLERWLPPRGARLARRRSGPCPPRRRAYAPSRDLLGLAECDFRYESYRRIDHGKVACRPVTVVPVAIVRPLCDRIFMQPATHTVRW
jgi:hypothetical protein